MKQTFTKYNAKNTNSSGRAVFRQGTLRRPGAVLPNGSTSCRSDVSRKTETVRRDDATCLAGTLRHPDAVPSTGSTSCCSDVSRKTETVRRDDTSCLAGTLRRPDAVPPISRSVCLVRRIPAFLLLLALCCVSCRNVIEAPDETAEIAESGGGEGRLYTLSGAVGAGGAAASSLAGNSRGAFFSDTGGGYRKCGLRRGGHC